MIPNRIIRYFYCLGYAFSRYGHTQFPTFKNSVTDFYFAYIEKGYCFNNPSYYPKTYGMNWLVAGSDFNPFL